MNNRFVIDLLGLEKDKAYGFQEYIFNLLHFFYKHKDSILYDHIIIWCKDTSAILFEQFKDSFKIEVFSYSSYLKRYWLQTMLPIKYRLSKKDLLFSPGNYSGVIKCGTELLTIHDLLYKRKNWIPNRMMRWQRELMIPISIKKADHIVAISKFTREEIEYYYPSAKGKVTVIYNSFNFEKYNQKEHFGDITDYFIAISTNANYKNQRTILAAFHKYYEMGGEKRLVIIGSTSPKSEASKVYRELPQSIKERIIWKSNISNSLLGSLYRNASCFISASKFEGLGMPVVEAMYFGLPVLLSDIAPHREISMNMGEYFAPEDVDRLAELMLRVSYMKKNYDKEIMRLFSEDNTSAKYVELINKLYAESRDI